MTSRRASSPGPWRNRSSNSSLQSKPPPSWTALLMFLQTSQFFGFISIEPIVYSIWVAGFEQSILGYPMGRVSFCNLQDRRTALPNVGTRIVISMIYQFLLLDRLQCQGTYFSRHLCLPLKV